MTTMHIWIYLILFGLYDVGASTALNVSESLNETAMVLGQELKKLSDELMGQEKSYIGKQMQKNIHSNPSISEEQEKQGESNLTPVQPTHPQDKQKQYHKRISTVDQNTKEGRSKPMNHDKQSLNTKMENSGISSIIFDQKWFTIKKNESTALNRVRRQGCSRVKSLRVIPLYFTQPSAPSIMTMTIEQYNGEMCSDSKAKITMAGHFNKDVYTLGEGRDCLTMTRTISIIHMEKSGTTSLQIEAEKFVRNLWEIDTIIIMDVNGKLLCCSKRMRGSRTNSNLQVVRAD